MIRTKGKVFDAVKQELQDRGIDTSTLQIITFGRVGSYYDIILDDRVVGTYEGNSKTITLTGFDK